MIQSDPKAGGGVSRWHRMLLFALFLGLLAGFGLLYITYGNINKEMLAARGERQLIHARQAARGSEAFFQDHVRMPEPLARNEHIAALDGGAG